ncbi:MAG: hypothetical protein GC131_09000 [Alphaproteobacteria bacterium]|nr:hypothetical protein [Alphaproteobacteria bacterium]
MRTTVVNLLDNLPVTIASGQSITSDLNLGGLRLFGIVMPASWTAANLTFQSSHDYGITWNNVYDKQGTEYNITAAAARFILIDPVDFASLQYLRLRSGTSGTPVNQAADRTVNFVLRSI